MNMNIIKINESEEILQSYQSLVCYINVNKKVFINFRDATYSRTTKKHINNFINTWGYSDYKDFIKNSNYKIIDTNDNPSNVSDVLQMVKEL